MSKLLQIMEKKRQQSEVERFKILFYNSEVLGEKIEIRKIKLIEFLSLIDKLEAAGNTREEFEVMNEIIFRHCPIFRENTQEAMEFYGASEPTELPALVLEEQVNEIKDLCDMISGLYGVDKIKEESKEQIKN